MNLKHLIQCCLTSDPKIVSGDYTVIVSNSKSGALNAGVLLFTDSQIDKRSAVKVEYRLVSILVMLTDLQRHILDHPDQTNFQVHIPVDFKSNAKACADDLINALRERGIRSGLAAELVLGENRLS